MNETTRRKRGAAGEKLPAEGTQARRFGKTRTAQATALLEDYVELIADLMASAGEARRRLRGLATRDMGQFLPLDNCLRGTSL